MKVNGKNYSLECSEVKNRAMKVQVYDNEMNHVCSHRNLDELVRKAMFFDKLFESIMVSSIVQEHRRVKGDSYDDDYNWMRLVLKEYLKTGIIEDERFKVLLALYSQKKVRDMVK